MKYSAETIESLMAAGLCSPSQAAMMAAMSAVASALPPEYRVVDVVAPAGVPAWVMVATPISDTPIGEVSAALEDAMAPCEVRQPTFNPLTGDFMWAVQAGMAAGAESEEPAEPAAEAGDTNAEDEPQA